MLFFILHCTRPCDTKSPTFRDSTEKYSGRSAVWSAHLPWEQGAGGSNPPVPTSARKGFWLIADPFFNFLVAGDGGKVFLETDCHETYAATELLIVSYSKSVSMKLSQVGLTRIFHESPAATMDMYLLLSEL